MGVRPKFSGNWKSPQDPRGNFIHDKGFWKLLIDRRMYDCEGNFQDLTPVDSSGFEPHMVDPKWTGSQFNVTTVADDAGVERIRDAVIEKESRRTDGGMPTVDYGMDMRQAVSEYDGARFMREESDKGGIEEVNSKFNEDLQKYIAGTLTAGYRFNHGMPSVYLRSAGFDNLPISMRASLLAKKAGDISHPFEASDLHDLVKAIQKPIAILLYTKNNIRNLIVDLTHGQKHFLVGVTLNFNAGGIEINSVSGLFPKESHEWIKWIQDGRAVRIDQKDKVQSLIDSLRTNPAESVRIGLDLNRATNILNNFVNPPLPSENNSHDRANFMRETSREYMEAVEKGDMEKAGRMVREAAKRAMPDTKVVDENGEPLVMYHGTNLTRVNGSMPFWVFNEDSHFGTREQASEAFERSLWRMELSKIYSVYLNIRNPKRVDDVPEDWLKTHAEYWEPIIRQAKEEGYDGLVYKNTWEASGQGNDSYVAFSPNQIKSADPVTYDDAGNVIPLEKRFDDGKDDIRFKREERDEGEENALLSGVNEWLRDMGLDVIEDVEEGQRVLDEDREHQARLMGSKTNRKKAKIAADLAGVELSHEQQDIVDVFIGKKNRIRRKFVRDDGIIPDIEFQQGNEQYAGSLHSLYRHYDTGSDYYTTEEILFIPNIIRNGKRDDTILKRNNKPGFVYQFEKDGVCYTVLTEKRGGKEIFNNYYTDRKNTSRDDVNAEGDTELPARSSGSVVDANIRKNSETPSGEIKKFRTSTGEAYGFVKDGKIYIDPRIATAETPVHEYGHLWAEALRKANPAAWERLKNQVLGDRDVADYVKGLYPELTGDNLAEEVFVHFAGKRGAERLRRERDKMMDEANGVFEKAKVAALFDRLARALKDFWQMSRDFFAGKVEGLENLSAEDFADMMLSDLANKVRLNAGGAEGKDDIRFMREEDSLDAAVRRAEKEAERAPSDGQKEAGNYRKGHVRIDGFDISIEQARGSVRSGTDKSGKKWSVRMHDTYGYIRGTEGVDGDHIDVFLSGHLDDWNGMVYVVDQVNGDGDFDEHKVMYGFNSAREARDAYLANYSPGWKGLGVITGVSREEFKKWVESSHRKTKAFAEYKRVSNKRTEVKKQVRTEGEIDEQVRVVKQQVRELMRKYKPLAPIFILDTRNVTDKQIYEIFGNWVRRDEYDDVREWLRNYNNPAFYNWLFDKTIILADKVDINRLEECYFHENLHKALYDRYKNGRRIIADTFWDASTTPNAIKNKRVIEDEYAHKPFMFEEEFLVCQFASNMVNGNVDVLLNRLPDKDKVIINNYLTEIGYDKERERELRRGGRGTVGNSSTMRDRGSRNREVFQEISSQEESAGGPSQPGEQSGGRISFMRDEGAEAEDSEVREDGGGEGEDTAGADAEGTEAEAAAMEPVAPEEMSLKEQILQGLMEVANRYGRSGAVRTSAVEEISKYVASLERAWRKRKGLNREAVERTIQSDYAIVDSSAVDVADFDFIFQDLFHLLKIYLYLCHKTKHL